MFHHSSYQIDKSYRLWCQLPNLQYRIARHLIKELLMNQLIIPRNLNQSVLILKESDAQLFVLNEVKFVPMLAYQFEKQVAVYDFFVLPFLDLVPNSNMDQLLKTLDLLFIKELDQTFQKLNLNVQISLLQILKYSLVQLSL